MFKKMDTDNDGIVSIEELKAGFRNFGSHLAESEVQMLIEAVSVFWFILCHELTSIMILYFPGLC
ncbi:CPK13; ATP binding / calcium ion binding / calcium-and calmodulin-dependent protein kinase/ kinase/ protein kinase/ protein serine/threonine kinase/ protein-tyrosine kinase [Escherichia coli]|nr:CPK13; ATP binding / calcium ion binding / calcium-and calmodulin-dependent protein kinase/ kinase/ protein kinase/ protein serine/threonine kinase/ protein-tyrosine kinase [Escherichia coli]